MNDHRRVHKVDPAAWPEFDAKAFSAATRKIFTARIAAIELYADACPLGDIEARTGVHRRQLYQLLERCNDQHEDGRVQGWRAVVPYMHVKGYERTARLALRESHRDRSRGGAAGAFSLLLESQPKLAVWIADRVKGKRVVLQQQSTDNGLLTRLLGLKHLHIDFLRECRSLGITGADYPFNVERAGIRSLSAAVRAECLRSFDRAARQAGASQLKGLPHETSAPATTQFLDVVEFDGHRLDVRLKVVLRDPLGFEQEFEVERVWLLVVLDVFSRAVLGYRLSLNPEYSRYDVIHTLEAALAPHHVRSFTLPGVGYGELGGFPSGKMPELIAHQEHVGHGVDQCSKS